MKNVRNQQMQVLAYAFQLKRCSGNQCQQSRVYKRLTHAKTLALLRSSTIPPRLYRHAAKPSQGEDAATISYDGLLSAE